MIEPGDLVWVVSAHCDRSDYWLGHIFTVAELGHSPGICSGCLIALGHVAYAVSGDGKYFALSTLRKIPPLPQEEQIEGVESVHG